MNTVLVTIRTQSFISMSFVGLGLTSAEIQIAVSKSLSPEKEIVGNYVAVLIFWGIACFISVVIQKSVKLVSFLLLFTFSHPF